MLDLVIAGGQVVTPQGVGALDIGVQGANDRRAGLAGHPGQASAGSSMRAA